MPRAAYTSGFPAKQPWHPRCACGEPWSLLGTGGHGRERAPV